MGRTAQRTVACDVTAPTRLILQHFKQFHMVLAECNAANEKLVSWNISH
jgi:hypothetical protein